MSQARDTPSFMRGWNGMEPLSLSSFSDVLYWLDHGCICVYTTQVYKDSKIPAHAQVTKNTSLTDGKHFFIVRRNNNDRVVMSLNPEKELEVDFNQWKKEGLVVTPSFSVPE